MPAEQGRRLDEQQCLAPGPEAAGEQHEERPIGRRAAGSLDAAPEDEERLAQEGVLRDERGPTAHEVGEGARRDALRGGLRRGAQAVPERAGQGSSEIGAMADQARQHGRLLPGYRRRLRDTPRWRVAGV